EAAAEVEPGGLARRRLGAAKAVRRLRVPEAKEGQRDRVPRPWEKGGAEEKLLGAPVPRGETWFGSGEPSPERLESQGEAERWSQRPGEERCSMPGRARCGHRCALRSLGDDRSPEADCRRWRGEQRWGPAGVERPVQAIDAGPRLEPLRPAETAQPCIGDGEGPAAPGDACPRWPQPVELGNDGPAIDLEPMLEPERGNELDWNRRRKRRPRCGTVRRPRGSPPLGTGGPRR